MVEIEQSADVLGGEPRIAGTRVGILDVYELVSAGDDPEDVADQLDLSLGQVYAALSSYYEHPEEMRDLRRTRRETETTLAEEALQPPEPAQ